MGGRKEVKKKKKKKEGPKEGREEGRKENSSISLNMAFSADDSAMLHDI